MLSKNITPLNYYVAEEVEFALNWVYSTAGEDNNENKSGGLGTRYCFTVTTLAIGAAVVSAVFLMTFASCVCICAKVHGKKKEIQKTEEQQRQVRKEMASFHNAGCTSMFTLNHKHQDREEAYSKRSREQEAYSVRERV